MGEPIRNDPLPPLASLAGLLRAAATVGASDLHLCAGVPPLVRVDGTLTPLDPFPLDAAQCEALCCEALDSYANASVDFDVDLALDVPDVGRCRVNLFRQSGTLAGAFRLVPSNPPRLSELGLPAGVERILRFQSGLVLVTGATGSGKSTTLAALIREILTRQAVHVLTIEDPIEFVHEHGRGVVRQREIGRDAPGFAPALRHVLRQDPDVILIGEMRDIETMRAALTLAETGHLVLSTLHSHSALDAADRLIDAFPADEQGPVRRQVAQVLCAVVAQRLLPRRGGGRAVACELMFLTPAIRALIRDAKSHQIHSHVQSGRHEHGMQTMADAIEQLSAAGIIARGTDSVHLDSATSRRPGGG